jgi:hypothetical protein
MEEDCPSTMRPSVRAQPQSFGPVGHIWASLRADALLDSEADAQAHGEGLGPDPGSLRAQP